jgi:hypothetical protein
MTTEIAILALPEDLHPIAVAAHPLPAGSYGVVIVAGDQVKLATAPIGLTTSAATYLAENYRNATGCQTYIVRRGRDCVTVHTGDMGHRGNLLGTEPAPAAEPIVTNAAGTWESYWVALINKACRDADAQADHDANIVAALRRVHRLPAKVSAEDAWAVALRRPRDAHAYVVAFAAVLYAGDTSVPRGKRHLAGRLYATHV